MPRLVLGTAGHIDHGKTALIRALTGIDTDRLPEEKRRGITIDIGFANLRLPDGQELAVVDVPGHEAFIRNMLAGATGIDIVLLVIAADEGVMPQTREHLAIVDLLGVRRAVVAITKTDLVEPDWLDLVIEDIRAELAATPFADAPLVPVSAVTGAGLDQLTAALAAVAAGVAERDDDDLFRLPIDRVFTIRGTGTVITGTVWSGRLAADATVRILPAGLSARVRGAQVHGRAVPAVAAGQRAALALAGAQREQLRRGLVVVSDEAWTAHSTLTALVRVLPGQARGLRPRQRIRFHLGTAEVMGRITPLDSPELAPGTTGWAQLRLEAPVVARAGDRFVLRSYSPVTTIAGGTVAEPLAPPRRRLDAADRAALEAIIGGTPAALTARVGLAGWSGCDPARLAIETPLPPRQIAAALQERAGGVAPAAGRVFSARILAAARELILTAVQEHHAREPLRPGVDRDELRRRLPRPAPPGLADDVIAALLAEGVLRSHEGLIASADFEPRLTPDQERARSELLALLEGAGLAPPTLPEWPEHLRRRPDLRPLLRTLEREGRIVALGPELYAARPALDAAAAAVRRELAGRGPLGPAEFRECIPVSRKYLIPILEYFDRTGVTRRAGDRRLVHAE
ncbi:MAG TPA: selenocysteine-specific translation elongation factor [Longimicrobiales bacterium]